MSYFSFSRNFIRRFDWLLGLTVLLLLTVGLVFLYSLEANQGPVFETFYKQLLFAGVSLLSLVVISGINYQQLSSYTWVLYVMGFATLVGVLLFGQTVRGVRGWFIIGPVSIQPIEFVKVIAIVFFAGFFSKFGHLFFLWRYIALAIGLIVPLLFLTVIQPDFGSAFIVGMIWLVMLLFTKIQGKQLVMLALVGMCGLIIGWSFLAPYQQARLTTFIDPERDPLGQGYNVRQAITAVGSGQLVGLGLGQGPQSQLRFLPENKTDFIFSVIAEELGFIGAGGVTLLYAFLLYRMLRLIVQGGTAFGIYLCVGATALVATQAFMNIGMNIGIFPVTGVPLPLISQGGSSLLAIAIALGLTQSVATHTV